MKIIIALSTALLIATEIGVRAQSDVASSGQYIQNADVSKPIQSPTDVAWRHDMAAFAAEVAVVASNSIIPNEFQLSQSMRSRAVLSGQSGTPTWVVLNDGFEKELHGELVKNFGGQIFWRGKVTTAETDQQKKTCNIRVEFPKANGMPSNCELSDVFLAIPFDKLPAEKLPAVGTVFAFTGNMEKANEDDLLDRVWVLYGLGENAGKNRIGVSLTDEAPLAK